MNIAAPADHDQLAVAHQRRGLDRAVELHAPGNAARVGIHEHDLAAHPAGEHPVAERRRARGADNAEGDRSCPRRATASAPYTASPALKSHATVNAGRAMASTCPPVVPR